MMGTGASRWLETSHHLPAVMHGMRMPEEMVWDDASTPGQRNLRAWFGKMTLLPSYQRLLETKMDFDEFTNRTTRHLLASGDTNDDLKAIGCAGGRHLVESEGSCTYSICTLRPGTEKPPTVGCSQACNYHTEFFDAKCEKKCDCAGTTTQADVCWMLCVARLPVNECALEDQQCSGLKMICSPNSTDSNTTATPAHTHAPVPTTQPTVVTEAPTTAPPATAEPSTRLPTDATTPSSTTATPIETSIPSTLPPIATLALAPAPTTTIPTEAPSPSATETPTEMPITQDSPTQEPVLPGGYC